MVPQRQYRHPEEMPLVFSQPREVITRPEMTVIYAPPTKVIMVADELPRMYNSDSDTLSDTSSSGSDSSWDITRGQVSGVVRDRHGRYAVVVKDMRGRKVKGVSDSYVLSFILFPNAFYVGY